jgi:GT2 family glycosyltransferase
VGETLAAVVAQLRESDELFVVDNHSSDGTVAAIHEAAPEATVIEAGANLGFGAGCNRGATAASGDLLVFLNPDAVVQPGWREAIEAPLVESRGWAAWQGLVTAAGGRVINTRGGVVHFTGIAWAGGAGDPLDAGEGVAGVGSREASTSASEEASREAIPAAPHPEPGFLSGACLAIPRKTFLYVEGFPEAFFLYHEDVDLSLRLRLLIGGLGVELRARVDHEYEFEKGPAKWRYLERNRWATLIRTYPAPLLVLLAPALFATELALIPAAIAGGWFGQKVWAWADTVRWLPRLVRERRRIRAAPTIGAGEFAAALTAELDSAYLGAAGRSRLLAVLLRIYWRGVLGLLRLGEVGRRP